MLALQEHAIYNHSIHSLCLGAMSIKGLGNHGFPHTINYVLMHLYGSHKFFTLTSSQFLGVFWIQFSYCMRMYLSTTCIQDKYHFIIFLIFISLSIGLNMEHSKQLKSSTCITITAGHLSYSSSYLNDSEML